MTVSVDPDGIAGDAGAGDAGAGLRSSVLWSEPPYCGAAVQWWWTVLRVLI